MNGIRRLTLPEGTGWRSSRAHDDATDPHRHAGLPLALAQADTVRVRIAQALGGDQMARLEVITPPATASRTAP